MTDRADILFFFDVDNTVLDNDRVVADLRAHLVEECGQENADSYFQIFEQLRSELGYADYLGALQRYRERHLHEPELLKISSFLVDYPFADRLYPRALDLIGHVSQWGPAAILSDGDVVFQPRKVERSGLWKAVDGRVLIYIHKERELGDAARRYPARHYVLFDDKLRILAEVKRIWGDRVTTVFPRQGHYAHDAKILADYPAADVTVERIGDALRFSADDLRRAARRPDKP